MTYLVVLANHHSHFTTTFFPNSTSPISHLPLLRLHIHIKPATLTSESAKMAASMASCGFSVGVYDDLIAIAKQPTIQSAVFSRSFASNPVKYLVLSHKSRLSYSLSAVIPKASSTALEDGIYQETDEIPVPKVIIDQDSDVDATVVEITFGDRLGALLDTMRALRNLGLNVVKGNVHLDSSGKHTKFSITKASTGRKVEDPELLEAIRLTIISNLLEYHPESSAQLAMGEAFGIEAPKHKFALSGDSRSSWITGRSCKDIY